MAKTLPNISVGNNDWVNLATSSGMTEGDALMIQNITTNPVIIAMQDAKPDAASTSGYYLPQYESYRVTSAQGIWIKSMGYSRSTVSLFSGTDV